MAQFLIEQYEKELEEFQELIKTHPNLPQNLDKLLLLRFLKVHDFDVNKAKDLLILHLEVRRQNPIIFNNRDVLSDEIQQAFKIHQACPMPRNYENNKITVVRLVDSNPDHYVYIDVCRMITSMIDVSHITNDELVNGEISVCDMGSFSFTHFLKSASNLTVMRGYMRYVQDAVPTKIVQNHFINCSWMMHKFMAVVRPLLKKEVMETLHFHTSLDSLHEALPKEYLPEEFGGTAGSMENIYSDWLELIVSKRDYLLNDENWMIKDNRVENEM